MKILTLAIWIMGYPCLAGISAYYSAKRKQLEGSQINPADFGLDTKIFIVGAFIIAIYQK